MARFETGDRVRVNITIGSIYDKSGTITGYAQTQYAMPGQLYSMPNWKVKLANGRHIEISERYLIPDKD